MDWKKTLATVAPALATALGGPMAGVAVSMAGKALGLGEGVTENDLAAVVASGSPDALLKLKQADNDFKLEMEKLGVKIHEIDAGDRDSARKLAINRGTVVQTILSSVLGFSFAYVLIAIFEGRMNVDPTMKDIAIYALGTLNALLVQVFNFWFGSSEGSKSKSESMAKAIGK